MEQTAAAAGRSGRAGHAIVMVGTGLLQFGPSGSDSRSPRAIWRRISSARRSTGFTSGHASCPQVGEVMERIKSRARTQGSRYGSLRHSMT